MLVKRTIKKTFVQLRKTHFTNELFQSLSSNLQEYRVKRRKTIRRETNWGLSPRCVASSWLLVMKLV